MHGTKDASMNSPLEISFDVLSLFALLGCISLYFGLKLSKKPSKEDPFKFRWYWTEPHLAMSLISNGLLFLLGSLAVILAKLVN